MGNKAGNWHTGPAPFRWITGPDPLTHEQYQTWQVHKAQANFRNEAYDLPFDDYKRYWDQDGNWYQRGRQIDSIVMSRIDSAQAWSPDNIRMVTRRTIMEEQALISTLPQSRRRGPKSGSTWVQKTSRKKK